METKEDLDNFIEKRSKRGLVKKEDFTVVFDDNNKITISLSILVLVLILFYVGYKLPIHFNKSGPSCSDKLINGILAVFLSIFWIIGRILWELFYGKKN